VRHAPRHPRIERPGQDLTARLMVIGLVPPGFGGGWLKHLK